MTMTFVLPPLCSWFCYLVLLAFRRDRKDYSLLWPTSEEWGSVYYSSSISSHKNISSSTRADTIVNYSKRTANVFVSRCSLNTCPAKQREECKQAPSLPLFTVNTEKRSLGWSLGSILRGTRSEAFSWTRRLAYERWMNGLPKKSKSTLSQFYGSEKKYWRAQNLGVILSPSFLLSLHLLLLLDAIHWVVLEDNERGRIMFGPWW